MTVDRGKLSTGKLATKIRVCDLVPGDVVYSGNGEETITITSVTPGYYTHFPDQLCDVIITATRYGKVIPQKFAPYASVMVPDEYFSSRGMVNPIYEDLAREKSEREKWARIQEYQKSLTEQKRVEREKQSGSAATDSSRKKYNRFGRGYGGMKGGAFKCNMCGRLTRDTGDNASVGLCPDCLEEAELENMFSDGAITGAEYKKGMADVEKRRQKRKKK